MHTVFASDSQLSLVRVKKSKMSQRLTAEMLKVNLGGTLSESDVIKEGVKKLSYYQLLSTYIQIRLIELRCIENASIAFE